MTPFTNIIKKIQDRLTKDFIEEKQPELLTFKKKLTNKIKFMNNFILFNTVIFSTLCIISEIYINIIDSTFGIGGSFNLSVLFLWGWSIVYVSVRCQVKNNKKRLDSLNKFLSLAPFSKEFLDYLNDSFLNLFFWNLIWKNEEKELLKISMDKYQINILRKCIKNNCNGDILLEDILLMEQVYIDKNIVYAENDDQLNKIFEQIKKPRVFYSQLI